jgi:hypothetical protein
MRGCGKTPSGRAFTWLILLTAVLVFPPPGISADIYNEVEGTGLLVRTEPEGAKVFIDGVERGETPLLLPSILNGEYGIRLVKEGYMERRFLVVIRSKSRIEVTLDLEKARGELFPEIKRDPAAPAPLVFEPALYIDGARVYDKIFSLPVGWHSVVVEAFGWEKRSEMVYLAQGELRRLELVMVPAKFSLGALSQKRKRFNPNNPGLLGTTELVFTVSAPGQGKFEVFDRTGRTVFSGELGPFTSWQQNVFWNGKDGGFVLPSGIYTLCLTVSGTTGLPETQKFAVELDASMEIRPLSAASSAAGLFFSPSPETLPAGSYQIEGLFLAGKPLFEEAWKSLPLALALRFSFLDRLELAAALNLSPRFGTGAVWGGGASAKWTFVRPDTGGFGAAAAFSYGWAAQGPFTAFGMGTGAALSLPVLLRILRIPAIDLMFSPGILWAGPHGYPEYPAPRIEASGGVLFSYKNVSGGVSARWDYAPAGAGPLMSALELKFFPSNCTFSLSGGLWYWHGVSGFFFGAGFGIMY